MKNTYLAKTTKFTLYDLERLQKLAFLYDGEIKSHGSNLVSLYFPTGVRFEFDMRKFADSRHAASDFIDFIPNFDFYKTLGEYERSYSLPLFDSVIPDFLGEEEAVMISEVFIEYNTFRVNNTVVNKEGKGQTYHEDDIVFLARDYGTINF